MDRATKNRENAFWAPICVSAGISVLFFGLALFIEGFTQGGLVCLIGGPVLGFIGCFLQHDIKR